MTNAPAKTTPKDVFLHLFNIVTFYLSVIGFITLYIQYIIALFPDPLNYYFSGIADSVRVSTSILFISVPAFLLSSWLLAKDLKAIPEKRDLKLRKWLIYFTLFISAITIIIDLIIFVYNFLNGELTLQFFLKVLVVLLVAGSVFGYYIWELRRSQAISRIPKILTIAVSAVVVCSIILGFFIVGTPADQRERRFDEQRVSSLQMLQSQIVDYWVRKSALPESTKDLENNISGFIVPTDPGSKADYEYRVLSPLSFELCAVFSRASKESGLAGRGMKVPSPYFNSFQQNWDHDAGRFCWTRTIDPDLYKVNKAGTPLPIPVSEPVRY
ncbi:MAG: DUF5671 domain-containing protein [Patescibacteria group bacterium]